MIEHIKKPQGRVRVWNEVGDSVESSNLVTYGGADIISALLSGDISYRIAVMYFAFENTAGVPTPFVPARTDTANLFWTLAAPRDFIRGAVLEPVQLASSGVNYAANQSTYLAIANAVAGVNGVPFGAGNNSKVFSLGLLAAPTGLVGGDVLFAHYSLPTAIAAAGSGQISASWTVEAD